MIRVCTECSMPLLLFSGSVFSGAIPSNFKKKGDKDGEVQLRERESKKREAKSKFLVLNLI